MLTVRNPDPVSFRSIKYRERAAMQSDIEAFFAAGGHIQKIPTGVSGEFGPRNFIVNPKIGDDMQTRNRRAAKRARETQQQSSDLFKGQAADYLGITVDELDRLIAAGKGPTYFTQGRGNARQRFKIAVLDAFKRTMNA